MPLSSGATSNLAVIAPITITSAKPEETYRRNERPQIAPIPKLASNPRAATLVTEIIADHLSLVPQLRQGRTRRQSKNPAKRRRCDQSILAPHCGHVLASIGLLPNDLGAEPRREAPSVPAPS